MALLDAKDVRLEKKYLINTSSMPEFVNWLRLCSLAFSETYPCRCVNSLYFDDYGYSSFDDNVAGVSARAKVRYRWYGEMDALEAGMLEVKLKRNTIGHKLHFEIPLAPGKPELRWPDLRRALEAQLPIQGRLWLGTKPHPVLIIRYTRRYFMSRDSSIRATVDSNLMGWDQRWGSHLNFSQRLRRPALTVVEFKFDPENRDRASQILRSVPARASRHSKYVTFLEAFRL